MPQKLTPTLLRNLKPPAAGRVDYADGDTPGLCLRVSAHNGWKWTLRMRGPEGGLRRFVLGDYTDKQGLKWARDRAEKMRQQVRHDGRDPHRERKEAAAAAKAQAERDRLTLAVLVDDWKRLRLEATGKSGRYVGEAVRALERAFADQWQKPAEALDRDTVRRVLHGLMRPRKENKPERGMIGDRSAIASRTAAYGRACYAWAVKFGSVAGNPFALLPLPDKSAARERVLTDDELVAVWRAAEAMDAPFGPMVRFLILTGQRREEVACMEWSEVSPDLAAWTIPGSRTKNGKPHIVPLPEPARVILRNVPRDGAALVFPGARGTPFGGWSKAKARLDKAMVNERAKAAAEAGTATAPLDPWRIHDLRRTLATGLQRLGVRMEVTEAVLNHISGSRAGIIGVYQRHEWAEEKRAALDTWAAHVQSVLAGQKLAENVVALRRA